MVVEANFSKSLFQIQKKKKNEYHNRVLLIWIKILNKQFLIFKQNLLKKVIFGLIDLLKLLSQPGFNLNIKFWIFGLNLPNQGTCGPNKKVNITMKFNILKLDYVPNFIQNRQFWFFEPNLPKKDTSGLKQEVNINIKFLKLKLD